MLEVGAQAHSLTNQQCQHRTAIWDWWRHELTRGVAGMPASLSLSHSQAAAGRTPQCGSSSASTNRQCRSLFVIQSASMPPCPQ